MGPGAVLLPSIDRLLQSGEPVRPQVHDGVLLLLLVHALLLRAKLEEVGKGSKGRGPCCSCRSRWHAALNGLLPSPTDSEGNERTPQLSSPGSPQKYQEEGPPYERKIPCLRNDTS